MEANTEPSVTIIIPVYNVASLLKRCIESALAQTYSNIQIILINDGSTDYSGTICDSYAKEHSQVIAMHQENKGLSEARNLGLKNATGDWIFFLDSDDFIAPNCISTLMTLAVHYNAEIAECSYIKVSATTPPPATPIIILARANLRSSRGNSTIAGLQWNRGCCLE